MTLRKLSFEFFDRHHVDVARDMIGTHLNWDGVGGTVVETEAYAAAGDPACHTFFRPSARAFFAEQSPGIVYVYLSYGVHWMLNVLARDGIVLIRALEPTSGVRRIELRRKTKKVTQLCSGPGKVGQALLLRQHDHGSSIVTNRRFLLPRSPDFEASGIVADARVGLSVGLDRQWRFLLEGNRHVSVPPGKALGKARTRLRPVTATENGRNVTGG